MCTALLGVMGMQYYFIRESYRQKSQLFDLSVNNSLSEVVRQLAKRDAASFLKRKASAEAEMKNTRQNKYKEEEVKRQTEEFVERIKSLNTRMEADFRYRDSILRSQFQRVMRIDDAFYTTYLKNPKDWDKVSIRVKLRQSVNYADGRVYQNEEHELYAVDSPDAIHKKKKGKTQTDSAYYLIENPGAGFTLVGIPKSNPRIARQIKKVSQKHEAELRAREKEAREITKYFSSARSKGNSMFFQDLADEYERFNMPLSQRVNTAMMDTLVSTELQRHGISLPFNFRVVSANSNVLLYAKAGMGSFDGDNSYSTMLFPKEFTHDAGMLSISFPGKERYLVQTMNVMMGSSLALLIVMVGCFAYTILTIFKQKKISEMKTDFINNMTHEFKTPVATIMIASEALKDRDLVQDSSRITRLANIIYDENVRLGDHIERVLNVARIDRGELKLEFKDIEMNDLISAIADSMHLQFEKKGARVSLSLEASRAFVSGDELHLSNVIFNLIDNALKYSKDAPLIDISTTNTVRHLHILVKDHGIGMNKDQISRIFEQFYRIPTGNRHDVKGFGLGLSYVNNIVKRHHGTIKVRSEKDKGSEFEIILPLCMKPGS